MNSVIIKNGIYYIINNNKDESLEKFSQRCWFIVSQQPKTNKEYQEAVKLSHIWINVKYYKCTYNKDLMDKIKNIEDQMYE